MTFNEYQQAAMRTAGRADGEEISPSLHLAVMALGVAGEAGEVADMIKKHLGHGKDISRSALAKELGDVLWYLAAVAHVFGLTLDDVAAMNIEKLKARYPDGFSHAASNNRSE